MDSNQKLRDKASTKKSEEDIQAAAEILKNGGVVGMPTETVYGLAADIRSSDGIDNIFQTKKRPFFDPLIVHIADMEQIKLVASAFPPIAQFLAKKYWPGPLTLILPKLNTLNPKITSGLESVGVRFPKHPVAQKLIQALGSPVAAPSANLFGKTSPTTASHVRAEFENKVFVLEGGSSAYGIESTVVGFDDHFKQVKIYRPGSITKEMIQESLDKEFSQKTEVEHAPSPAAPGQLKHHYMPNIPLVLIEGISTSQNIEDESFKEHLKTTLKIDKIIIHEIKLNHDPVLCARELYQDLRESAQLQATVLVIRIFENMKSGLWEAILDRLYKAATLNITNNHKGNP